jgi:O-succinylbenzoate synthase
MTLRQLSVHPQRLPFRQPWHTATGIVTHAETIFLRAQTDFKAVWVETCPLFAAKPATRALAEFARRLVGRDLQSTEAQAIIAESANQRFVHAGLDLAAWALRTDSAAPAPVPCARAISMHGGVDSVLQRVAEAVAASVPRVKLKIAPGHDLDLLRPIRNCFPQLPLLVDANAAYTLESFPRALDDQGLDYIEQPVASLADSASLQGELRTPICLDESIRTPADARSAIAMQACRAISIKIGRVGGMNPALEIADFAAAVGIPCWVGSMLESPIGTAHNLALAAHPHLGPIHGITEPSDFYLAEALASCAAYTRT